MFRWKLASKQKSRERREFRPALKDSVDSTSPKKINSGSQPDGKSQFSPLSRAVDLNRIIRRCVVTFISPSFPILPSFFLSLSLFLLYRRAEGKKWKRTRRAFSGLEVWPLPWMKVNLRKWRPDLCIMTSPAITQTINIVSELFFSKYKSDKFMCPSRSKAERITFYESSSSRSHRDYYSRETNLNFWRDYAPLRFQDPFLSVQCYTTIETTIENSQPRCVKSCTRMIK